MLRKLWRKLKKRPKKPRTKQRRNPRKLKRIVKSKVVVVSTPLLLLTQILIGSLVLNVCKQDGSFA